MVKGSVTWRKFHNRLLKVQRTIPSEWKASMPKVGKSIVHSMERLQPRHKGDFILSQVREVRRGHAVDIKAKPGAESSIMRTQWGTPGLSGRGPYPLYWRSNEDRQRVLQELLAEEAKWVAGGRKGRDRHVSQAAIQKLLLEGKIIRYGPFKGKAATHFINRAVANELDKIRKEFSRPLVKAFKGMSR